MQPDSSHCSYDNIINGDWGPDENWSPVDNISDCEDNKINIAMLDNPYFVRITAQLSDGYSMTPSAGDEIG